MRTRDAAITVAAIVIASVAICWWVWPDRHIARVLVLLSSDEGGAESSGDKIARKEGEK
jgi:hypothetical protein